MNQDIAVVIDYENLYYTLKNSYKSSPNLGLIMDAARQYGRIASSQAFADWSSFRSDISTLFRSGIQPVFCPSGGRELLKSSVDTTICVYTMKLFHLNVNLKALILVSGDRDFLPLVSELKQSGKQVVVIAPGRGLSSDLADLSDEMMLYEDLLAQATPKEEPENQNRLKKGSDPYPVLVELIRQERQLKKPTLLSRLKLLMKERIIGFNEQNYKDSYGRNFIKFKELVQDAEARGIVKILRTGLQDEVFLPHEDAISLSKFRHDNNSQDNN